MNENKILTYGITLNRMTEQNRYGAENVSPFLNKSKYCINYTMPLNPCLSNKHTQNEQNNRVQLSKNTKIRSRFVLFYPVCFFFISYYIVHHSFFQSMGSGVPFWNI